MRLYWLAYNTLPETYKPNSFSVFRQISFGVDVLPAQKQSFVLNNLFLLSIIVNDFLLTYMYTDSYLDSLSAYA